MTTTNIPKQVKNTENSNCNCYCGCLSGNEKEEKLEENDFKILESIK